MELHGISMAMLLGEAIVLTGCGVLLPAAIGINARASARRVAARSEER